MKTHEPLSVVYLLEDTVLFGGVKVILRQADLLTVQGHDVTVVARGPQPDWYDLKTRFLQVAEFSRENVPPADVVVATYWSTITAAIEVAHNEVAHYCQGYEASYTHNTADHDAIVRAYTCEVPALVVSDHLGELLNRRFARPSRRVLQPLEAFWTPKDPRQRLRRNALHPARILVPGPWEGDWKGVPTGLRAVIELRKRGFDVRVVRLSQYPLTDAEQDVLEPDEYHLRVPPVEAARIVRSCDLTLAPSWEQEGFGLPVLESFAAGVPVVASDIAAFRGFAADAALLAPVADAVAFATHAAKLLSEPPLWRHHRKLGFSVAAGYSSRRATRSAEDALRWVASGAWRTQA